MSKSKLLMKVVEDMGALTMSLEAVVVAMALEEQGLEEGYTTRNEDNVEEKSAIVEEKLPLIWKTEDKDITNLQHGEEEVKKVPENKKEIKKEGEEKESIKVAIEEITLEQVRAVLAEKSQAGFTSQVKDLIRSYGANKLSQVKPVYYESLMELAMKLESNRRKEVNISKANSEFIKIEEEE